MGNKKKFNVQIYLKGKDSKLIMQVRFPDSGKQLPRELFPQNQHTEADETAAQGNQIPS